METKVYPAILVVWRDIVQSDQSWRSHDEALEWSDNEDGIVHQVGFKLDQTEDDLVLVDSMFANSDIVGSVIKIPMKTVISITELTK